MILIINSSFFPHIALIKNGLTETKFLPENITTSETLLPCIEKMLKQNKISIKDISAISVCIGPGSFTGTRIALATAFAIAYASKIKLIKFNLLELLLKNAIITASGEGFYVKIGEKISHQKTLKESYKSFNSFSLDKIGNNKFILENEEIALTQKKFIEKDFSTSQQCEPLYLQNSQAENLILTKIEVVKLNKTEAKEQNMLQNSFVAKFKNQICGRISLKKIKGSYFIEYIFVEENFRKMGVATKLIQSAKMLLNENCLYAKINKNCNLTISLYNKLGDKISEDENFITYKLD